MGKRQERITKKSIATSISKFTNQECNLVLNNLSVLHGFVISVENNLITLEDNRLHIHKIPFHDIDEIIIEKVTSY